MLDVKRRVLVVHREPLDDRYTRVRTLDEREMIVAAAVDLAVPVLTLL